MIPCDDPFSLIECSGSTVNSTKGTQSQGPNCGILSYALIDKSKGILLVSKVI